jgi:DNA polymerase elongation subunit (family B)
MTAATWSSQFGKWYLYFSKFLKITCEIFRTTSAARVHLLKEMQKLLVRSDVRILYFDTDSILYQYDTQLGDPMADGQHLGEMTGKIPFIPYIAQNNQ